MHARSGSGRTALRRTVMVIALLASSVGTATAAANGESGTAMQVSDYFYLLWYLSFFVLALVGLLVAMSRGWFRDVERAKYHMMEIDEPDYYTPEWAKEELDDGTNRKHE